MTENNKPDEPKCCYKDNESNCTTIPILRFAGISTEEHKIHYRCEACLARGFLVGCSNVKFLKPEAKSLLFVAAIKNDEEATRMFRIWKNENQEETK